ncbi:MAG: arsenate reductase ArsC [Planctomycetes bacterium]|nr:arsenate reductase ArsC [Planctomycetota bacterium]
MKKRALFLCTGNSARSQMAEGLLRHMAGDKFEVTSAGIKPSPINPFAIKAMAEIRIDISNQYSKDVSQFINKSFDYVITLCDNARQTCPFFPGKAIKLHWGMPDPADAKGTEEEILTIFRKVRDEIKNKIISQLIER